MIVVAPSHKGGYVNNVIKELLDLKDLDNVVIVDVKVDDASKTKTIVVEKVYTPMFCPECNERMLSKGFYLRHVKHPVLDDGYQIIIELRQRKFRCSNKECNTYINEEFAFVERNKRTTYITPLLVLKDLKDITITCAYVARHRNVSETWVHLVVMSYLKFDRLPLPEILCIDEVYLNICKDARYCVVLRDFLTGDIIDILPNRYEKTFENYFLHIPRQERLKVKFIISDMYEPYLKMPEKYFNKAVSIIDSFHVISWINNKINLYINEVKKKYQKIDDEKRKERNYKENKDFIKRKDLKEVYLLKNHRWVLLMNDENIDRNPIVYRFNQLGGYYSYRMIEEMFLALDPNFPLLKQLKDKYISFNNNYLGKPDEAKVGLEALIEEYKNSNYQMFKDFAEILNKRKQEIVASFTSIDTVPNQDDIALEYRRMSNGPMEGFNRKPKDMKRLARGYSNFDFVRNRILWAERKDAHILGSPIPIKAVRQRYKTKTKRGHYKKHK